jgi:hypothetical protein
MGSGISSPIVSAITREQLLRSTTSNREFTNKLFQVMIQHLTPEDFLKLARTQTCNNYIFMMAESIQHIFEKLQIRPRQDKDTGVVYFQKIERLRTPPDESRQLCLIIAYYYIRIFQLFGALAMTVIDDPSAGQVLGLTRYVAPPRPPSSQPIKSGFFGFSRPPPPGYKAVPFQRGGSKEDFKFFPATKSIVPLYTLFEDVQQDDYGNPYFEFKDSQLQDYAFFPKEKRNLYIKLNNSSLLQCRIQFIPKASRGYEPDSYSVKLDGFVYETEVSEEIDDRINSALKNSKSIDFSIRFSTSQQRWVSASASSYELFETMLVKATKRITEFIKKVKQGSNETIPEFARRTDTIGLSKDKIERRTQDIGITKSLQNEYIINTLKSVSGNKTVSFCIARAFQLLDANTTYNPRAAQSGTSGVCAKFDAFSPSESKKAYSVPQPRDTLDKVPGLHALDQLYYTKPSLDQKDGYKVGLENPIEYVEFLKKMTELFGSSSSSKAQSLDAIRAKEPDCVREAMGKYLQITEQKGIASVMKFVSELFNRQLNHTKRVIQFLQTRLVLIKNNQISIHPRLLKGGLDELAVLSKDVRSLLVDYYSSCESIYQKGAKAVLEAKHVSVGR